VSQEESSGKRCKSEDESNGAEENFAKGKAAQSSSENGGKKQGKDSTSKPPPEPPKDYIHVRARRGEATDTHSLAERVQFLWISIAFFLEAYCCAVCLCYASLLLLNNSGEKGKDQPKDEASAGSCAGLQQGNRKALIVDINSLAGHLD
jgi:hypothetical protein